MSVHRIDETCSCGATFSIVTDYAAYAMNSAAAWRRDHRHPAGQPRTIRPRPGGRVVTANEAHVRAVAEALQDEMNSPAQYAYCSWDQCSECQTRRARVAVATLTPLIAAEVRAEVAAAIRVECAKVRAEYDRALFTYGSAIEPGSRDPFAEAAMDAHRAARIATEETP